MSCFLVIVFIYYCTAGNRSSELSDANMNLSLTLTYILIYTFMFFCNYFKMYHDFVARHPYYYYYLYIISIRPRFTLVIRAGDTIKKNTMYIAEQHTACVFF